MNLSLIFAIFISIAFLWSAAMSLGWYVGRDEGRRQACKCVHTRIALVPSDDEPDDDVVRF
jgi:hypothetical protein